MAGSGRNSAKWRRVYRRRRIAALVLLALAGAALVAVLWGIGQAADAVGRWIHSGDINAIERRGVPAPHEQSGVADCGGENVSLQLSAPTSSTQVGGSITFVATIRHQGESSCLINGSDASRVLVITSGRKTVWRSDSCPSAARVLLMAGDDKDVRQLTWQADATGDTCVAEASRQRVTSGSYVARLHLRGHPELVSPPVPVVVE